MAEKAAGTVQNKIRKWKTETAVSKTSLVDSVCHKVSGAQRDRGGRLRTSIGITLVWRSHFHDRDRIGRQRREPGWKAESTRGFVSYWVTGRPGGAP